MGQVRYTDAEPFIVPSYEGMNQHKRRIFVPDKHLLGEGAMRVVRLYELWGKSDKALEWKAKLDMPDLPTGVFASP
jgi:hypothetical protein